MPSQPSPALKELDAKIQAKRLELEAIQQKEAELQEQIRNLDSQPTPAAGSGGEGAGQGAGEAWDKAETQRFMDSLLKAQRARKTKEAVAKASAANADKNLDVLLEAATRERKLAEVSKHTSVGRWCGVYAVVRCVCGVCGMGPLPPRCVMVCEGRGGEAALWCSTSR